jgi:multidrug efflux pump subunit AcrA (membrane-fusion protein)
VAVSEGRAVSKGTLLFAIRSLELRDRDSERSALEAQERGAGASLANARRQHESETRATEEQLESLREREVYLDRIVAMKKDQLKLTLEQEARTKKLHEQGLTSMNDRSDAEIRRSQTAMEVEQLESESRSVASAIQKLLQEGAARQAAFHERERAALERQEQTGIRIAALSAERDGSAAGDLGVPAPCDGTVVRVSVRGAGTVVRQGEPLCDVACSGETLRAALNLPQLGLPRVAAGQPVKLLFDAYPYQRYGAQAGTVLWASPAGVTQGAEPAFPGLVDLAEQGLRLDGKSRPFLAGMRGTARIVIGRRSAISWAYEPLRQLRENLK